MAFEMTTNELSLEASADLSTNQFHAVIVDTNGRAALAGAAVPIVGILQDKPAALGTAGHVKVGGITKAVAGAAVAANALVTPNATGELITAVATNTPAGVALSAAGAAGEVFTMLITPGGSPI